MASWTSGARLARQGGEQAGADEPVVGVRGERLDGGEPDVDGRVEGEGADRVR